MIAIFADRDTEKVWLPVRRWLMEVQRAAYRKLLVVDAADLLQDLNKPPGIRLEGRISMAVCCQPPAR
jgi:toxin HigB-1